MSDWERKIPAYFSMKGTPDTSSDHLYPKLVLQRTMLKGFYLSCCMLFHRSLPCALPSAISPTATKRPSTAKLPTWDYDKIAHFAISVLRTEQELLRAMWWQRQVCFTVNFLAFEAAITLSIVLLRDTANPASGTWQREQGFAIDMFQSLRARDFGDIVPQALKVLCMLQETKPRIGMSQSPSPTADSASLPMPHGDMAFSSSPEYMQQTQALPVAMLNSFWPEQLEMPLTAGLAGLPMDNFQPTQAENVNFDWMPDPAAAQVTSYDLLRGFDR